MSEITLQKINDALKRKGYRLFDSDTQPYNLNIVGIRSNTTVPNRFDDHISVIWKYQGNWNFVLYEATTDPGLYWLNYPMSPHGTAILKEGQYRGSHKIGKHKNYRALEQAGNVTVIRDYDKDGIIDYSSGVQETGLFSINIHRAKLNGRSIQVDKWSAGCQVFASSAEFDQFMRMCDESSRYWGNSFTYTLLHSNDLQ